MLKEKKKKEKKPGGGKTQHSLFSAASRKAGIVGNGFQGRSAGMRGLGGTLNNLSALLNRRRTGESSNQDAKVTIMYTAARQEASAVTHVVSR